MVLRYPTLSSNILKQSASEHCEHIMVHPVSDKIKRQSKNRKILRKHQNVRCKLRSTVKETETAQLSASQCIITSANRLVISEVSR